MYACFIKIIKKRQKYSNKFAQSTALGIPALPLIVRIQDVF